MPQDPSDTPRHLYDIAATTIDGRTEQLGRYRGRVLLIVNVASHCGFTPQYEGLEALYRTHGDRGLVVLGFPCNQFGAQEPGTEATIRAFCSEHYDVSFPMFAKVDVNGPNAHPLFRYLTTERRGWFGQRITWNFTKFLVDRQGTVVRRFGPAVTPARLEPELLRAGL